MAGAFTNPKETGIRWNILKALFWGLMLVWVYRRRVIIPHVAIQPFATWDQAMADCRFLLLACDEVFLVPGWKQSQGACLERRWAQAIELPTYTLWGLMTKARL